MNPLVFRTALPFGYLVAYGALLALALFGLVQAVTAVGRRRPGRAAAGALAAAFAGYVFWVNVDAANALDLNPLITAPGQLAGRWAGEDGAALVLAPDGTYRCAGGGDCRALGSAGRWERVADFEVALRPTAAGRAPTRYRVVRYNGQFRLAHPIDEDPDLWDGELPFAQVAPAPARGA